MSKENKEPKITKGERTKRHILETAAHCYAEYGIEHTTTRLIAQKAGVSRGLVSYYCPQVENLLEQVLGHIVLAARSSIRINTDGLSWEEKIAHQIRGNFESFEKNPHYYQCFLLSYYYCSIKKQFSELHRIIDEGTYNYWYECFQNMCQEQGVQRTPEEIKKYVRSAIYEVEGSLLYFFIIPPQDRKNYIDTCVDSHKKRINQFLKRQNE